LAAKVPDSVSQVTRRQPTSHERLTQQDSATPRRQFIGELAAGAAALAAVACTPAAAATSAPSQAPAPVTPPPAAPKDPLPPQSAMKWDPSWLERITAKHRAVFDSPEINDGAALDLAFGYLGWVKDVFGTGDSDASVVVVLRHAAVPTGIFATLLAQEAGCSFVSSI
jgi:hypothetical protein